VVISELYAVSSTNSAPILCVIVSKLNVPSLAQAYEVSHPNSKSLKGFLSMLRSFPVPSPLRDGFIKLGATREAIPKVFSETAKNFLPVATDKADELHI